jgi:hypothetical protein
MILVNMNGIVKEENETDYKNFQDFLSKHEIKGKVLTEIKINDQDIPLSVLHELDASFFEGEERITLTYKEYKPFTVELIGNIQKYLDQLREALPIFAARVVTSDPEALRGIKDLGEGLKSVITMKESVFTITGTTQADFISLRDLEPGFSKLLTSIGDAMEKKDWALLSNILEFQLPEKLKGFYAFFDEAKALLNSTSM